MFVVTIVDVQTVVLGILVQCLQERKEKKDFEIEKGLILRKKVHQYINGVLFKANSSNHCRIKFELRNKEICLCVRLLFRSVCTYFSDNSKQNVGWIRIEGDMVYYYTAKALFDIWRPDMTAQENKC